MGRCFCHTCKKVFQSLGIARHRAMHRDKKENAVIEYSNGKRKHHLKKVDDFWQEYYRDFNADDSEELAAVQKTGGEL